MQGMRAYRNEMEQQMDHVRHWFGSDTYNARLEQVRRFWQGEGRFLISMPSFHESYRQLFDEATILTKMPLNLADQAQLPGMNFPTFYADFGTVSTTKYWGGTPRFDSTGDNIFIDPVAETVEDALAITPLPVDDPSMDAVRGLDLFRKACTQLGTDDLWLRTPDFQGTMNTAAMIMNQEEFLMAMYAEPDSVHEYLQRVNSFLIDYGQYLIRETGGKVCGSIWPPTFYPSEFGMSFTEDMMPLVSAEIYREFGIPCLRTFEKAFGGLHIHCCGDWGRHAPALAEADLNIMAVECHYPLTPVEALAPLAERAVFVPIVLLDQQERFSSISEYYRYLIAETPAHYRYWFIMLTDDPEARAFMADYPEASGWRG